MRVLLDECVPALLGRKLMEHSVHATAIVTTQEMGWASKKNGDLIQRAESDFDVFITSDRNLQYQQNLSKRSIAILLLPTNRWPILSRHLEEIAQKLDQIMPRGFETVVFSEV